jgi:hypothetical protein
MNKYAFDTLRDSKGRLITKQKANEFNNRKTIEHLLDTIETVSKIKQQVKVVTRTIIKHDTLTIRDIDTLTIDGTKYIGLPLSLYRDSEWYSIGFTVDKDANGIIDSIVIINKPSFYYGYDKWKLKNLLEKREPIIVFKDDNPYIEVKTMENIIVKEKKKPFSIGVQTGYGITKSGLSPYVGLGLQYNIK